MHELRLHFKKLMLIYSVSLFVLTVLFSSLFFVNLNRSERERARQQQQVLLADFSKQREATIERLITSTGRAAGDETLATFAVSSGSEYYQQMVRLRANLYRLGGFDRASLMVHKQGDETCVTGEHSGFLADELAVYGLDPVVYQRVIDGFSRSDLKNRRLVITEKGMLYITSRTFSRTRMLLCAFEAVDPAIVPYGDEGYAGLLVLAGDVMDLRQSLPPAEDAAMLTRPADASIPGVSQDASTDGYLFQDSDHGSILYYYRSLTAPAGALPILLGFLPIILATFVLSFLLVAWLSKRLYRPIDRLIGALSDMQDDTITGAPGRDIEALAAQVTRIRSENHDLIRAVSETRMAGKQRFLSALVDGTHDRETLAADLTTYELAWLDGPCTLIRAELTHREGEDMDTLTANVMEIVLRELASRFQTAVAHLRGSGRHFIVDCEDPQTVATALSGIVAIIDTAFGLQVVFLIGERSDAAETLHRSLLSIERLWEGRMRAGFKSVYTMDDLPAASQGDALYPLTSENKLLQAVEAGDLASVERLLVFLFDDTLTRAFDDPSTQSGLRHAFANTIRRCAERLSVRLSDLYPEDGPDGPLKALAQATGPDGLRQAILAQLSMLSSASGVQRTTQEKNLKPQIEAYIRDNITREISLISMADHFKITPNYMSAIFKNIMGENFKEYTSAIRFEAAVALLRDNPQVTMTELAEQSGIHNTSTLLRLFRKHAGCSPSAYAEQHFGARRSTLQK